MYNNTKKVEKEKRKEKYSTSNWSRKQKMSQLMFNPNKYIRPYYTREI